MSEADARLVLAPIARIVLSGRSFRLPTERSIEQVKIRKLANRGAIDSNFPHAKLWDTRWTIGPFLA